MTAAAIAADKISYTDLYERWEKANWRATEIDFSEDRRQWHEVFSAHERRAALWNYSLFFHGEDSVAENLSPYIDAAPREEQRYFLATQQVDEARHAVLFGRFMREVAAVGADSYGAALDATRPELTWGFRKTFERLDRMADELRRDRSKPKLAAAVTLYHLVVEATLAQPGQHFIEGYLTERDILPGFREGMGHVSNDEQRHIAFGVKLISDLVREDPECKDAIGELLREVIPVTAAVFVPPGWDESYVSCFGATLEDVYEQAATALDFRLRAAGLEPDELRIPLDTDLPPRERARRGLALLRANYLGERLGEVSRSHDDLALFFDGVERSVNHAHVPAGGATIQWDFTDAEPWHLRIDNGATRAEAGRLEAPDLTFRCRLEDWIALSAGREDPRRLLLTRRIRPKGSLRLLARMPKIFR